MGSCSVFLFVSTGCMLAVLPADVYENKTGLSFSLSTALKCKYQIYLQILSTEARRKKKKPQGGHKNCGISLVKHDEGSLWSPYVIGQTIYIFMLWFVYDRPME